jgi:hypothetical protein
MNLTQQLRTLQQQYKTLGDTITGFEGVLGITTNPPGTGTGAIPSTGTLLMPHPGRRKLSAAGSKRIAAAQKARWAKIKAAKAETTKKVA